jgi:protein TonB
MRRALVLSLALHLGILLILMLKHDFDLAHSLAHAPTRALKVRSLSEKELQKELTRALDSSEKPHQIVQTDDSLAKPEAPKKTDEKIFLSKTNQVADKNTRAARFGKFKNVLEEGVENPSQTPANQKARHAKTLAKDLFKLTPNPKDLEQQQALKSKTGRLRSPASIEDPTRAALEAAKKGKGLSATDDYLEDVAVGANTLLNAKQFAFYGFYERIRQRLSDEWSLQLNQELDPFFRAGQTLNGDRRTKVEIELDRDGQLKSVRVVGSSGIAALDRAATRAFQLAAPFPNPPVGMLDKDSKVHIRWDFVVVADAGSGLHFELRRGY